MQVRTLLPPLSSLERHQRKGGICTNYTEPVRWSDPTKVQESVLWRWSAASFLAQRPRRPARLSAYCIDFPVEFSFRSSISFDERPAGTRWKQRGMVRSLRYPEWPVLSFFKKKPRYHSKFGGLWIDRCDADRELAQRRARGGLLGHMEQDVAKFMADGYLILHQAVDPQLADRIAAVRGSAVHGRLLDSARRRATWVRRAELHRR